MGRLKTVACALACWLSAGCEYTTLAAETGASNCTNLRDEDGDGKRDCADPDCWGYAHCRVPEEDASAPFVPVVPPPYMPGEDMSMPPTKPAAEDAGQPSQIPGLDDAAIELDAAPDAAPLVCDPSCPAHRCIDGECVGPTNLGTFTITSLEASVPRARDGVCLDPDEVCPIRLGPCCAPDPDLYVSVSGMKVASTDVDDMALIVWQSPGFVVELHEDDVVKFELLDDDTGDGEFADAKPDPVFECSTVVTMDNVSAGVLRCSPGLEGQELGVPYGALARIRPAD